MSLTTKFKFLFSVKEGTKMQDDLVTHLARNLAKAMYYQNLGYLALAIVKWTLTSKIKRNACGGN